jgi:hypothetical protein
MLIAPPLSMSPRQSGTLLFKVDPTMDLTSQGQEVRLRQEAPFRLAGDSRQLLPFTATDHDNTKTYLTFRMSKQTGKIMAEVIDIENGKVLREVPFDTIIGQLGALDMLRGMILDVIG